MSRVLVVAPHPDDESLGCGGSLLKWAAEGAEIGVVFVTAMTEELGFSRSEIDRRRHELRTVCEEYGAAFRRDLELPTTRLDVVPRAQLVGLLSSAFGEFQPETLLLPWPGDAHSDHRVCFHAAAAAGKAFRQSSVRYWLAYETLSETEAAISSGPTFDPNLFVDISDYLERKLAILSIYASEMAPAPFPRSLDSVRSLAAYRGASTGVSAAEAFTILRARW